MGYDGKYGKVTTEHGDIPDDEPVIVFRGRDRFLPDLLEEYYQICEGNGSTEHHTDLIEDARQRIVKWQNEHRDRVRTPSSSGPAGQSYWERNGVL